MENVKTAVIALKEIIVGERVSGLLEVLATPWEGSAAGIIEKSVIGEIHESMMASVIF